MKWNNKFTYPKSSRSLKNGFRHYLFDNNKLPSVTSILQATKSEEDKAALENWKQRVGHAEANKIKNEASSRGSSMHLHIENFLKNRINNSFFEENEQYKNMAKEIINKGIKGKLEEIYEGLMADYCAGGRLLGTNPERTQALIDRFDLVVGEALEKQNLSRSWLMEAIV